MIPAFSIAILAGESPSSGRGRRRSAAPRDGAVGDVGGVPGAAEADLDHGHVDRGVGERGERHPDDRLEERQRVGLVPSTRWVYGATSLKARTNASSSAAAVDADPLAHPLDVRAGEAAGAQLEGAQQGVDHPRRRGLAVGAGQVDHRVAALRVAEQLGERADPVERRLEPGLGPAGQQGVLDLGVGLGEAGSQSGSVRAPPSLARRPTRGRRLSPGGRPRASTMSTTGSKPRAA